MPCPVMRGSLRFLPEGFREVRDCRARQGRRGGGGGLGCGERTASAICSGCALRRSSSASSWATTLTIPPTPSSRPASDTGCQRGRSRESEAPMARRSLRSSVPTHHTTGIERPRCVDRLPSHISKMVVSTVCGGGRAGVRSQDTRMKSRALWPN